MYSALRRGNHHASSESLEILSFHTSTSLVTMTGFLDLPGEIRNRIYILAFPEQQVLLRCSHPKKAIGLKSDSVNKDRRTQASQLYASLPHGNDHLHHQFLLSAHFLRVCCKIHEEALPLLYANTGLQFESMKAINLFLSGAASHGQEHIKKLSLNHSGYGEPGRVRHECWKTRHDQRWVSTCKKIAEAMSGLQHLKLSLVICDWPVQLNLNARWAKPLFYLKGSRGLDRVDIYLRSMSFSEQRLAAASRMVETAMMSERGRAQRQLENDLRTLSLLEEKRGCYNSSDQVSKGPPDAEKKAVSKVPTQSKAKKVLTIKIEGRQKLPR